MKLSIQVTEGFVIDAGNLVEKKDEYIVIPPEETMFDQVWTWLEKHPQKSYDVNGSILGIGTTALCYRWGSYLSVLVDENKPISPNAKAKLNAVSMISQHEMMRINIEVSHNLARLFEKMHKNYDEAFDFIQRAYDWLPMPQKRVKSNWETVVWIYKVLEVYKKDTRDFSDARFRKATQKPYRSLANTMTVLAYRNGPIENIHAGKDASYNLFQRRMTINQSREVIRHTSEHMSAIMSARPVWQEGLFSEKFPKLMEGLPYVMFYPLDWSLSKSSSKIILKKEWCK